MKLCVWQAQYLAKKRVLDIDWESQQEGFGAIWSSLYRSGKRTMSWVSSAIVESRRLSYCREWCVSLQNMCLSPTSDFAWDSGAHYLGIPPHGFCWLQPDVVLWQSPAKKEAWHVQRLYTQLPSISREPHWRVLSFRDRWEIRAQFSLVLSVQG